eukprot:4745821-Pyramimonas_sp.AAC.1
MALHGAPARRAAHTYHHRHHADQAPARLRTVGAFETGAEEMWTKTDSTSCPFCTGFAAGAAADVFLIAGGRCRLWARCAVGHRPCTRDGRAKARSWAGKAPQARFPQKTR